MQGQLSIVVEACVGPLAETIAEDDHAAPGGYLQVEFDMPVSEDIVVPVVLLLLLVFGEQHQLLFVLAFVRAGVGEFFQPASFGPVVAEMVSPTRRQASEQE